ncbi:hypothetical protein C7S14_3328 [Burkholderia cepacia]|nr:hypothetical protein C7S14_3328 [Burkholderia cepacia]
MAGVRCALSSRFSGRPVLVERALPPWHTRKPHSIPSGVRRPVLGATRRQGRGRRDHSGCLLLRAPGRQG